MVEIRKVPEAAIRRPSPVSQKNVKMGMESEKLSKCLDEADSSRLDFIRAHCREQIETQRTPTTTCKLAKKLAIVAEVDAQAIRYREHHRGAQPWRWGTSSRSSSAAKSAQMSSRFWWQLGLGAPGTNTFGDS